MAIDVSTAKTGTFEIGNATTDKDDNLVWNQKLVGHTGGDTVTVGDEFFSPPVTSYKAIAAASKAGHSVLLLTNTNTGSTVTGTIPKGTDPQNNPGQKITVTFSC